MRGITLIELMVVVVIIGILVSIAYPGYQAQIQKSRRATGKAVLLDTAQRLERCFTRYNAYDDDECDIATSIEDNTVFAEGGWYLVTDEDPGPSTFRLVATPQGQHANDTQCANLTLNQRGEQDVTGTAAADLCWR
jgi:type IV pilus assembly protein PilE